MPTNTDQEEKSLYKPDGSHDKLEDMSPAEKAESDQLLESAKDSKTGYYQSSSKGRFSSFGSHVKRNKAKYGIGGVGGGILLSTLVIGSIFLAPLKLDFFTKNIEQVRMSRMQQSLGLRSQRFMTTMIMAQIAGDVDGDPGRNRYFLAKGWQGNGNPITTWYRDLKTTAFFDDIQKEYGFVLANDAQNNGRLVAVTTLGLNDKDIDSIRSGLVTEGGIDGQNIAEFERRVTDRFEHNKDARRFINNLAKDKFKWWQITKRRHVRLWARERLGITKWKFFENTREDARSKVRARWAKTIFGKTQSGRLITCLISGSGCADSDSLNDPENKPQVDAATAEDQDRAREASAGSDAGDGTSTGGLAKRNTSNKILSKIMSARVFAAKATNVVGIMNTISQIHKTVGGGAISKMVRIAKMTEYATAFITFQTLTDQMKSGEKVSGEEVDATLEMFANAELSGGYQNIMAQENAQGAGVVSSNSVFAQGSTTGDNREKLFDPVTEDMKINSDNNATRIEDVYNSTLGVIIGPIANAWDAIPIKAVYEFFAGLVDDFLDEIGASAVIQSTLNTLSEALTGKSLEELFQVIGSDLLSFLGATPKCGDTETDGRRFNCTDAGGAVTQESFMQNSGSHTLTDEQAFAVEDGFYRDQNEEYIASSTWSKVTSLESNRSVLAQVIINSPFNSTSVTKNAGKMTASIIKLDFISSFKKIFSFLPIFKSSNVSAASFERNLYEVKPYGFTNEELAQEPFGGKGQAECDQEESNFNNALRGGDAADNASSICLFDSIVANNLLSIYTDKNDGGIGGNNASSVGGAGIGCPDRATMNQKLLNDPLLSFESNNPKNDISDGTAKDKIVCVVYGILEKVKLPMRISVFQSGHKCPGSDHCEGLAVDIAGDDASMPNQPAIFKWLYDNHQSLGINELIHEPQQPGLCDLDNGICTTYDSDTQQAHYSHIHVSVSP